MMRIRLTGLAAVAALATMVPFGRLAASIDGPWALCTAFLGLVVLGSAAALAIVFAEVVAAIPSPRFAERPVSPPARARRR